MKEGLAALALHRPSRPENIGGAMRAADVYGVELVVLGGGLLPPEPLGHPTDTANAWTRIPVVFAEHVLDALPEATPLPEFEHPHSAAYVFGPENGALDEALLARCPHVVSIPGHECSNLAAAVNVVLYARTAARWEAMPEVFPPTDGRLRGVPGGYEARLERGDLRRTAGRDGR